MSGMTETGFADGGYRGAIVRAIDLGYGNVKFTTQHKTMHSIIECEQFPSRSTAAGGKGLSAGVVKARDTVTVEVNGTFYEVGRDVALAQRTFDESSHLDKDFCLSDAYLARLRGALYYMMGTDKSGVKFFPGNKIGLLTVGLPVAGFQREDLHKGMKKQIIGSHNLPDGRTVEVLNVLILAQPLGAFFEYAHQNNMLEQMNAQNNLIIDIGYFTFDWLMCAGLKAMDQRSNSVNIGMSAINRSIAEYANKKEGWNTDIGMLTRLLDEHFRTGKPFIVFNKQYDVRDFLGAAKTTIDDAVSAMISSVGDGADIQNIILAGGGASLFQDAISKKFPKHKLLIMKDPVFSNVRGFQLAGEHQVISYFHSANRARTKG